MCRMPRSCAADRCGVGSVSVPVQGWGASGVSTARPPSARRRTGPPVDARAPRGSPVERRRGLPKDRCIGAGDLRSSTASTQRR
eukprot:365948-Chlamydomonas_euryale.AAC.19